MFDLKGKKAIVTGASGGIGGAIARTLHAHGAELTISGTRRDPLEALAHELGERVHVVTANLSDPSEVDNLPKQAIEHMGGVDILVNNAGVTRDNLFMRMSNEEWNEVLNINLGSSMRLARAMMRPMMKARWGRIISITSIVGVTGNPGQTNYSASKAGLIGFSKSLAQEVASRNITVNCVAPGFIATPMTDKLTEEQKNAIFASIPMGKMGTPEDIASAVGFLASNESGYVTGQTIHVNGGMAMI